MEKFLILLSVLFVSCAGVATSEYVSENTFKVSCPQQYDSSCYKKIEQELCPHGHKVLHKEWPLIGQHNVTVKCKKQKN